MEWIETTGATVDDAKERALDRLGVAEDELEYEILAEASRSMLGLKKTDARLRARVRPRQSRPRVERRDRNRRGDRSRSGNRSGRDRGNKGKDRAEGRKRDVVDPGSKQDAGRASARKADSGAGKSGNGPDGGNGDTPRRRRRGEWGFRNCGRCRFRRRVLWR